MTHREKVISDVQEALRILGKVDEPTFWLDFVINAVDRALTLLKAQEPVVLSIADIIDNDVTPEVIWVEMRDDVAVIAGLWDVPFYEMQDGSIMNDLGEEIARHPEAYGTKWRVWTARPTEEQRKAIPWE